MTQNHDRPTPDRRPAGPLALSASATDPGSSRRRVVHTALRLSAAGLGGALLLALFVTQTLGGPADSSGNGEPSASGRAASLFSPGSSNVGEAAAPTLLPLTKEDVAEQEANAEGAVSIESLEAVKAAPERTGRFDLPLKKWFMVTDRYGAPRGKGIVHGGIDLALDGMPKSQVYTSCEGAVSYSGYSAVYGYHVIVDCGEEWSTLYGHLSRIDVVVGQAIHYDDGLGLSGSTGVSSAEHLHFAILWRGWYVNPEKYLDFHIAPGAPLTYDRRDANGELIDDSVPTQIPTSTPTPTPTPDFNVVPSHLRPTLVPTRPPVPTLTPTPTPVTPTATPTSTPRSGQPG